MNVKCAGIIDKDSWQDMINFHNCCKKMCNIHKMFGCGGGGDYQIKIGTNVVSATSEAVSMKADEELYVSEGTVSGSVPSFIKMSQMGLVWSEYDSFI
jgi:hypothetical protein